MTPERWQEVKDLYHAVLEAAPSSRGVLLDSADSEVRREVETLLSAASGSGFLDLNVLSAAGPLLDAWAETAMNPPDERALIGRTLGHYLIEKKLDQGGMGAVYRATDTHLDRPVAIKVLLADALADDD